RFCLGRRVQRSPGIPSLHLVGRRAIGMLGDAPSGRRSFSQRRRRPGFTSQHGRNATMEHRLLGGSGFKVPVLGLGTATFGGGSEFFRAWGDTQLKEATRLVDVALEAGAALFDTADVYSNGLSEEILGKAIAGRRDRLLISTKT